MILKNIKLRRIETSNSPHLNLNLAMVVGYYCPFPNRGLECPWKRCGPGVILHQPLSLHIFRKIALFWPIFERDSCIPLFEKRRTPLPGAPENTIFGPHFRPKFLFSRPGEASMWSWVLSCPRLQHTPSYL